MDQSEILSLKQYTNLKGLHLKTFMQLAKENKAHMTNRAAALRDLGSNQSIGADYGISNGRSRFDIVTWDERGRREIDVDTVDYIYGEEILHIGKEKKKDELKMTELEITVAKIDRYANKNAYELTIEKYPNADIRMIHDDIRVMSDDITERTMITNYYNRAHEIYITLVGHGMQAGPDVKISINGIGA